MQDQAIVLGSGDPAAVSADEAEARAGLILGLRRRGIGNLAVLSAIERVPRRLFLSARHHRLAYEDASIPIECGQIASALHIIIQLERMSDGRRRLVSLSEITGLEGDVVTMHEIIRFRRTGTAWDGTIQGDFVATD